MTAPTIYYSDDAGAPVVSQGADSLYQILRACLIDGYGSKTAAGWSVVYDDWATNGVLTITNALATGILGLKRFNETTYGPGLFVCEAMIDSVTPVNARSGKYGINNLDSLTDSAGYQRAQFSPDTHTNWVVVANDNTVLFFSGPSSGLYSAQNQSNGGVAFMAFGALVSGVGVDNDTLGNFAVVGGNHRLSLSSSYSYGLVGNVGSTSASIGGGTVFYKDGAIGVGTLPQLLFPISDQGDQLKFTTRYLPLAPVSVVQKRQNVSGGSDIGLLPMLFSCREMSSYNTTVSILTVQQYFDTSLMSLRDSITVGGKSLTLCSLGWYSYAFISLDVGDWL
ncbi:hypothetical protein [Thalassolituus oleivorans]|uniref:hypothetical protein n=1 Tax=Thalassolituus oleivorans TaxID=187493 RepID=UPI0023EF9440|nr:hypothetical protein [Thalassolituus oleivorans]